MNEGERLGRICRANRVCFDLGTVKFEFLLVVAKRPLVGDSYPGRIYRDVEWSGRRNSRVLLYMVSLETAKQVIAVFVKSYSWIFHEWFTDDFIIMNRIQIKCDNFACKCNQVTTGLHMILYSAETFWKVSQLQCRGLLSRTWHYQNHWKKLGPTSLGGKKAATRLWLVSLGLFDLVRHFVVC